MLDIPRPRILLLEDDAGVRRFIQLALENETVELIACSRLSEALQVLAYTCLMVPGWICWNGYSARKR
ncbi:hypothetical protein BMF29_04630 [Comamonas kerstersii]|nr:hypothetical protein BMF29_04630 [Comamonas kerstersii]